MVAENTLWSSNVTSSGKTKIRKLLVFLVWFVAKLLGFFQKN